MRKSSPSIKTIQRLIRLLLSLVKAVAYDPENTVRVYYHHATFFGLGCVGKRQKAVQTIEYESTGNPVRCN
jgi:hypothetical protein